MIGAARDYKVKLCLPDNASPERKLILRAFGAELVLTNPLEGTDGAIRQVRRMVAADPGRYFYPDQYSNESNWRAHFDSTAPEIIEQTGGRITHFVAGLRDERHIHGHRPGPAALQSGDQAVLVSTRFAISRPGGSEAHGVGDGPAHLRPGARRRGLPVSTEAAYAMVRRLACEEGLMVGVSSGAALAATLDVARRIRDGVVVTVFPDGAEKYLSEKFWTADE
jgi:cysteine synthase B